MRFGQKAEESAAMFLEGQGYKILERNYRTRWAEIDIIALHKSVVNPETLNSPNFFVTNSINNNFNQESFNQDTLVFIEVKARNSTRYGLPAEAVSTSKQKKIIYAALHYIRENNIVDTKIRFDVMTILFQNGHYQMSIIPDAFQGV
ncbi:MAG: YraN family protein [Desulfamplus sp.]|nr:YraN family protein [Desulfamplus sp.]MBF0412534.1 YraN family protein [Desulfamplus sp.]